MNKIREVFEDRVISAGVWSSRSPVLTVCDFYLWGNLKGKVCETNLHTFEELKMLEMKSETLQWPNLIL